MSDYKGQQNTDAIINHFSSSWSSTYAAKYCRNYTFLNGQSGYLPAGGELYELSTFYSEVNDLLYVLGGHDMYDSSKDNYLKWSSTQRDDSEAWYLMWGKSNASFDRDTKTHGYYYCCARPFTVFSIGLFKIKMIL